MLSPMAMHSDQLAIDLGTVHRLVAHQFPTWATWPVRRVASEGTVNAIFRLGERLVARFPLRQQEPAKALRQPGKSVGLRSGHGTALVLRRHQPDDGGDGARHPRPTVGGRRLMPAREP
jgi:hypothetical protein